MSAGLGGSRSTAIVVLNWNGRDLLLRLLSSLRKSAPAAEVCIVDNASTDDGIAAAMSTFPEYEFIIAPSNLGFSGGNNLGIRWALERGFSVIGILNNDVVVPHGFLEPLLESLEVDHNNRYVSPQIRYLGDPDSVWFGGAEVEMSTGIYVHSRTLGDQESILFSPVVTGCALFAHRAVWEKVGLLDESYFLTFEDTEWCIRANSLGCAGFVVNPSVVYHAVSATISTQPPAERSYYYVRNGVRFLKSTAIPHTGKPGVFVRHELRRSLRDLVRQPSRSQFSECTATVCGAVDGYRNRGGKR